MVTERTTIAIQEQALAEGARIQRAIRAAMGRTEDARTLSALARKARIQRATLYAWFDGQRPEPETQERVAIALGIRRADLWPTEEPTDDPLLAALNRQTAALERGTCARLVEISTAQENGLRELARAIAEAIRSAQPRPPDAEKPDDADPVSSRRGRA